LQETDYVFDELGNRTRQIDANDHVTRFEYDALGRTSRRILPGDGKFEVMTYYADGTLKSHTDFNGVTRTFEYDTNQRLTRRAYPDGTEVGFTYTPTGQRKTVTDSRGITTYIYDQRDRLKEKIDPTGYRLSYTYDAEGNRESLTATVGTEVYATTYTYDELDRLETVTDPQGGVTTLGYDPNGNRTSLEHPNGVTTGYIYDQLNRLTDLTTVNSADEVLASYYYTLGLAGNRTRIDEHDGTSRHYTYDDLYRLIQDRVTGAAAEQVYQRDFVHDPVGNRRTQTIDEGDGPTTITSTYDDRDRLLTAATTSYSWDDNGNLTSMTEGDVTAYFWDFENQWQSVVLPDGTLVDHTYDADGVRVRTETTSPGGPTEVVDYLVDTSGTLSHVVAETDGAGSLQAYYVRGDDLLAVFRPMTEVRFYHADGLGSIRALTDDTETVTDRWIFSAFGELLEHIGEDPNAYLFVGEQLDPSSGYYYNRARWLDPASGRFVSVDLFSGRPFEPSTLHKYLYALSDPVGRSDPSGLFSVADVQAALSTIGYLSAKAVSIGFQVLFKARFAVLAVSTLGTLAIAFFTRFGPYALQLLRGTGTRGARLLQRLYFRLPRPVTQAEAAKAPNWSHHPGQVLNSILTGFRSRFATLEWHHIVGQQAANLQSFGHRSIHSILNLVPTPAAVHSLITRFYNSGHAWLPRGYRTFNQWIARQPWEAQYRIGLEVWREAMRTRQITWRPP
ncbi:MAG: RHS repeat protein, partial [bacterium]|nr:RHS repeat protein [bacterium]